LSTARIAPGRSTNGLSKEDPRRQFADALFANRLLVPTGTDGVYGYSLTYQRIVQGLDRLVTGLGGDSFEVLQFPPVLVRSTFDRTGYLQSFPDLMGTVLVFSGGDREHRELCRRYEEQ
jgi:hypothetical protein